MMDCTAVRAGSTAGRAGGGMGKGGDTLPASGQEGCSWGPLEGGEGESRLGRGGPAWEGVGCCRLHRAASR